MSLTSYRAAPPRDSCQLSVVREESLLITGPWPWIGLRTWRRPTLPRLGTRYHGGWGFSRRSSGWDRVRTPRHGHQVVKPIQLSVGSCQWSEKRATRRQVLVCVVCERSAAASSIPGSMIAAHGGSLAGDEI